MLPQHVKQIRDAHHQRHAYQFEVGCDRAEFHDELKAKGALRDGEQQWRLQRNGGQRQHINRKVLRDG